MLRLAILLRAASAQDVFLKARRDESAATSACQGSVIGSRVAAGDCSDLYAEFEMWTVPTAVGEAGHITLASNPKLCLDFVCDQDPCFKSGSYGPNAVLAECSEASPTFLLQQGFLGMEDATVTVASQGVAPTKDYCLDLRGGHDVQAYPCVGSANQRWSIGKSSRIIVGGGSSQGWCVAGCSDIPAPVLAFCPRFHPIRDAGVYDPSGPLLDDNGIWHQWEDKGAWSHWTSRDLIHWNGTFDKSTNFGGDTGSVSPTPAGVFAFWPIMSGPNKGDIGSSKSLDDGVNTWEDRGPTIPWPSRINTGYRDPVRAFQYEKKWWVGVGCGNKEEGAQFCLFEAEDDSLANFTDRGSLYTTNITYGEVDGNIVWQPNNVSADMMECPDFFPLGDKWVLIGSLYKTNQWWVGTLSGNPPRFNPERVGILDYGNGYAAKTGSTMVQSGSTRRLVFGFTGWSEPTMAPNCGRSLIHARELGVRGNMLTIAPIPEMEILRKEGTFAGGRFSAHPSEEPPVLATGSQVELRIRCTGMASAKASGATGRVGVRTLATRTGDSYLEIGYDFSSDAMYADHSKCCKDPNSIVQRAPLHVGDMKDDTFDLAVFVDGGLVESFASDLVALTPLVAPDSSAAAEEDRRSMLVNDIPELSCTAESWQLEY